MLYLQLSSQCLDNPMKHCLLCLIYYINTDTKTKELIYKTQYYPTSPMDHCDQSYLGKVELVYSLKLKETILT